MAGDGTVVPIQPLILPLFGGLTELEFLARVAGESETSPQDIVRGTFAGADEAWKTFLFNGFLAGSSAQPLAAISAPRIAPAKCVLPSVTNLEVVFFRDAKVDDGRYANNGWMQELPDPITKMTWDNAVLVSRKTARELGVAERRPRGNHVERAQRPGSDLDAAGHGGLFARPRARLRPRTGRARRHRRRLQRVQDFQREIYRDRRDG